MRYIKNIAGREIDLEIVYKGIKSKFKVPLNTILPVSDVNFNKISKLSCFNKLVAEVKE